MVSGGGGGGMMSSGTTGLAPLSITHSGGEMGTARRKLGKFSSRCIWSIIIVGGEFLWVFG